MPHLAFHRAACPDIGLPRDGTPPSPTVAFA